MKQILNGKTVLITAGPTREYLDPVRYISNESSGKMGYELTNAARRAGAKVVLISGPTNITRPRGVDFIPVVSAREMYNATMSKFKSADIIICTAAVVDFRPQRASRKKIKKGRNRSGTILKLVENPDILKSLGKKKGRNQLLVGFALETENLIANALLKLRAKNCDLIIANDHRNIGSGKANAVILDIDGTRQVFKNITKSLLAKMIIRRITRKASAFSTKLRCRAL